MKKLLVVINLLILFVAFNCIAQKKNNQFQWNLEKERVHNKNRSDSTKWSLKNWKADNQNKRVKGKPIIEGVFPVPDYNLADSTFNGLGNSGDWKGFELKNKKIIYHSLYVNKNNINDKYIPSKPNEVFFTIVALTDTVDTNRYTHTNISVTSRNHPHYVGQGFIKTKKNEIDFVSFITADRNAYALVNMRLFDLRVGRIVLVATKKDGTFRSLQLESPIMSSDEMNEYIQHLLSNDKEVIGFFTQPENI